MISYLSPYWLYPSAFPFNLELFIKDQGVFSESWKPNLVWKKKIIIQKEYLLERRIRNLITDQFSDRRHKVNWAKLTSVRAFFIYVYKFEARKGPTLIKNSMKRAKTQFSTSQLKFSGKNRKRNSRTIVSVLS